MAVVSGEIKSLAGMCVVASAQYAMASGAGVHECEEKTFSVAEGVFRANVETCLSARMNTPGFRFDRGGTLVKNDIPSLNMIAKWCRKWLLGDSLESIGDLKAHLPTLGKAHRSFVCLYRDMVDQVLDDAYYKDETVAENVEEFIELMRTDVSFFAQHVVSLKEAFSH